MPSVSPEPSEISTYHTHLYIQKKWEFVSVWTTVYFEPFNDLIQYMCFLICMNQFLSWSTAFNVYHSTCTQLPTSTVVLTYVHISLWFNRCPLTLSIRIWKVINHLWVVRWEEGFQHMNFLLTLKYIHFHTLS